MKKYEVILRSYDIDTAIKEVEVSKESEFFVWTKDGRAKKRSSYTNYCNTWDEAWSLLFRHNRDNVGHLRKMLSDAESVLEKINDMVAGD
jgi:hypothetical protein